MLRTEYFDSFGIRLPTGDEINKLVGAVKRLATGWQAEYERAVDGTVLRLYLIKDRKVRHRLDFDLKKGINYGRVIWAVRRAMEEENLTPTEGYPYKVSKFSSKKGHASSRA
ncbi:hypothetical protein [Hydrogenobacter thermophilus]|uniref:hypothetical protein n=1 Tax=Hydrogenobacter thermophilus TaxID=940 RepID=UPI0030FA6A08